MKKAITIFIIGTILIISIFLIMNYSKGPLPIAYNETLEIDEEFIINDSYSDSEELHFGHMPITYRLENSCPLGREEKISLAFEKISSETNYQVKFKETNETPDILIYCNPRNYTAYSNVYGEDSYYELVEGDAYFFTDDYNEDLITYGEVNFYGQGRGCVTGFPVTEVHEILHVFGFDHAYGVRSVMRPEPPETYKSCNINKIDEEIIEKLKEIYD